MHRPRSEDRRAWRLALRIAAAIVDGEVVELLLERRIELVADCRKRFVELFGAAGAQQWRGDGGIGESPGDRQRCQGDAGFGGKAAQALKDFLQARTATAPTATR